MTPEQAKEALERMQISENQASSRRGYRGPSSGTENRMATLQLLSEGVDFDSFESKKAANIAINERIKSNREARGPMAFSTAEGRLIPWDPVTKTRRDQAPTASPLTQSPNLRFPMTQGGSLGIDYDAIGEKARTEELRLAGQQPLNLTPPPTNFEQAGVKKESGGVIRTPYGIMSTSAPVGQKEFESSTAGIQGAERPERYTMTPAGNFQRQLSGADDRALAMARMAEIGGQAAAARQQKQLADYYAFRQRGAEATAQQALTPSFGTAVDTMRGAQALVEAERWKQAQAGRSPISREPLEVRGLKFRQTGMGQWTPERGFGNNWATSFVAGGPQPMQATQTAQSTPATTTQPSSFWQTAIPEIDQFPSTDASRLLTGTGFDSRILQPKSDRLGGLIAAIGATNRRRTGPLPFGMRGVI